eukprot:4803770-Pyramimonas_sp.AAC.1
MKEHKRAWNQTGSPSLVRAPSWARSSPGMRRQGDREEPRPGGRSAGPPRPGGWSAGLGPPRPGG